MILALAGTERGSIGSDDVSWPDFKDLERSGTLIQAFIGRRSPARR
jgi:hypothetical protein